MIYIKEVGICKEEEGIRGEELEGMGEEILKGRERGDVEQRRH